MNYSAQKYGFIFKTFLNFSVSLGKLYCLKQHFSLTHIEKLWLPHIKHNFVHKTVYNISLLCNLWMFMQFLFCSWKKTSDNHQVTVERCEIRAEM
jgi:hypothetical protein